jgi:hypothetical protein
MAVDTTALTDEAIGAVRAIRDDLVALRNHKTERFPSVASAASAMLVLGDTGDVNAAARATSQPSWRIIGWANQIAASAYPTEVVEFAGYLPPAFEGREDPHLLLAGVVTDPDLQLTDIVVPGEIILNGSSDFGFDMSTEVAWIVHPKCAYALSLPASLAEARSGAPLIWRSGQGRARGCHTLESTFDRRLEHGKRG